MKMRYFILFLLAVMPLSYSAQGLRIYDSQMNDVTGGTITLTDTSASAISAILTVVNSDAVTHVVKAHRVEISVPAGTFNGMVWGICGYAPYIDTTLIPITLGAGAQDIFQGDYYPDTTTGIATISYCFWDTANPSMTACVTVVYDNQRVGIISPLSNPVISFSPNPTSDVLYMTWSQHSFTQVNIFSVSGELIRGESISQDATACKVDFSSLPEGMYMVQIADENGYTSTTVIVHQ